MSAPRFSMEADFACAILGWQMAEATRQSSSMIVTPSQKEYFRSLAENAWKRNDPVLAFHLPRNTMRQRGSVDEQAHAQRRVR